MCLHTTEGQGRNPRLRFRKLRLPEVRDKGLGLSPNHVSPPSISLKATHLSVIVSHWFKSGAEIIRPDGVHWDVTELLGAEHTTAACVLLVIVLPQA